MIKGLYETHIEVSDLESAIGFYKDTMGLEFALLEETRRIAFFWIGEPKKQMLGLWEKKDRKVLRRHFAFQCDATDILEHSVDWLEQRGLKPYNFLKDGTKQ